MTKKISGVYKITNTVTGDFYIGSSKNVKERWSRHKWPSIWKRYPNNPMYQDMRKYGVDKFEFEILEEVEIAHLKETEQQFIEKLKPIYNNNNAKGFNIERCKKYHKSERYKESHKKANKKYNNQLCRYNGETLIFNTLYSRFRKAGIEHPAKEVKKYLISNLQS